MHELQYTIEHAAGYIYIYMALYAHLSHNNLFKKIKRTGLQGTEHEGWA